MLEKFLLVAPELWRAFGETLLMLGIGLSAAVLLGGPLGVILFLNGSGEPGRGRSIGKVLGWLVNTVRSFPFIILIMLVLWECALIGYTFSLAGNAADVGARTLWLQLGSWNEEAARIAEDAGLDVVMDRCIKIEHARFHGGLHLAGFDTGVISSKRQVVAR